MLGEEAPRHAARLFLSHTHTPEAPPTMQRKPRPCVGSPAHLEVVPEGPAAQHLEEGVVRPVAPHVLQVVVLPSGSHAALAVGHAAPQRHLAAGVHRAQEHRFELSQNQNQDRLELEQNQTVVKLAASSNVTVKRGPHSIFTCASAQLRAPFRVKAYIRFMFHELQVDFLRLHL